MLNGRPWAREDASYSPGAARGPGRVWRLRSPPPGSAGVGLGRAAPSRRGPPAAGQGQGALSEHQTPVTSPALRAASSALADKLVWSPPSGAWAWQPVCREPGAVYGAEPQLGPFPAVLPGARRLPFRVSPGNGDNATRLLVQAPSPIRSWVRSQTGDKASYSWVTKPPPTPLPTPDPNYWSSGALTPLAGAS